MTVLDRIFLYPGGEAGATQLCLANLTGLLVLGLLGYCSVSTYTTWRRLRHIPGPRSAGFNKWWMLRNTLGGNMHLALKGACEIHGERRCSIPHDQATGPLFHLHQTRHADNALDTAACSRHLSKPAVNGLKTENTKVHSPD